MDTTTLLLIRVAYNPLLSAMIKHTLFRHYGNSHEALLTAISAMNIQLKEESATIIACEALSLTITMIMNHDD